MSAVMSTLSMISGGRRAHRKLTSSRKSGQFSDAGEDRGRSQHDLHKQQRSASLQTLEAGGAINLDNLEAKMASIEVSLAGSRRRIAGGRDNTRDNTRDNRRDNTRDNTSDSTRELDALRAALADKDTLIQSLKKQLNASLSAARLAAQASSPTPCSGRDDAPALSPEERRALEERAASVRSDLDTRRTNIHELKRRLEKTHVTENIDSRIEQAELQYQLGREELELLTLGEQARALSLLIDQADAAARARRSTLYSTVRECGGSALLLSAEARDHTWRAALRGAAVAVDWAEHPALAQGDRVLEINGTSTVWCGAEELRRALCAAAPARLVLLRAPAPAPALTQSEAASLRSELGALQSAAEVAERAKLGLRQDNTRLTHRISYLEDQVAELLARRPQLQQMSSNDSCITVNKTKKNVTNISITSEPPTKTSPKSEIQVFQKGPDITAIVAKLPGLDGTESNNLPVVRPRSNASGASSRVATSPRTSPTANRRSHSSHSLEHRAGRMRHSLSHQCIRDYSAETDAAIRMIERNQRHMEKQRIKTEKYNRSKTDNRLRSDGDLDAKDPGSDGRDLNRNDIKKAAERIEESIKKTNWAERKTLSIIEQLKKSQKLRKMKKNESSENVQAETERHYAYSRIDGKVLENAHKSSRRSSKLYSRSAKSSELESECSDYPNGDAYGSSPRLDCGSRSSLYLKNDDARDDLKARPTPPRKPLRLSLHRAKSAHSLANGSESEASRPPSEPQNGEVGPHCKRPVKRTHAADRWARERLRDPRATPRPARRAPASGAPPADRLYPDKWC